MDDNLRFTFVGMLFAVAVTQIATQFAALLTSPAVAPVAQPHVPGAFIHLFFVTMLVAFSWVGWASSTARGNRQPVRKVFDWEFVVFLLDVVLVVIYFVMIPSAEIATDANGAISGIAVSAHADRLWFLSVCFLYFVWDVVTKLVIREPGTTLAQAIGDSGVQRRILVTFLADILALLVYLFLREGVVVTDVCLLGIAFLFRLLKQFWA